MGSIRTTARVWIGSALALLTALIALVVGQELATRSAVDAESGRVRATAALLASSFRLELEKAKAVSVVLADDQEARAALLTRDAGRLQAFNAKLESLNSDTGAAVIYLLDATGTTLAASNWRLPTRFVGHSYAFRQYFKDAIRVGESQQFALGASSGRPGLYLADRITASGRNVGVIVIKIEFDALEKEWRRSGYPAFATNQRGIILVTSIPDWRFQTTAPLSATTRLEIRRNLEFGGSPLLANTLFATQRVAPVGSRNAYARPWVEATETVAGGWSIHVLGSTEQPVATAITTVRLVLITAIMAAGGLFLLYRHRRRVSLARSEATIASRLDALNQQLVQANKLAALGQIAAGVGHEISQPVTTIGTYAHNGRLLIEAGDTAEAAENMERIVTLTTKIGIITRELRGFARRASGESGPVSIERAIEGTLLLLRDRIRSLDADVVYYAPGEQVMVMAEHVRLEQVLLNLVQNSLDAGGIGTRIGIEVRPGATMVEVVLADDGPGLPPVVQANLFQPFSTSKVDGLGLGLVISRDIMTDFGGELVVGSPTAGAEFIMRLRRAA